MPPKPQPLADRFWKHVRKGDGCWEWRLSRDKRGYGRIQIKTGDGRKVPRLTHRVSYELHHGRLPADMLVLHRCDNPPCVRPDHLFLGTQADNIDDMMSKGRHNPSGRLRGESNKSSKLTDADVRQIRADHATGVSQISLARSHGVSRANIGFIVKRKTWAHVA